MGVPEQQRLWVKREQDKLKVEEEETARVSKTYM